jgi:hypothetical protein
MSRGKGVRRLALGLVVAGAVTLLTAELGVRLFVPFPVWQPPVFWLLENGGRSSVRLRDVVIAPDSNEFRPNQEFLWCFDPRGVVSQKALDAEGCMPVSINSEGLRGPRVEFAKPPDTYRIAALGDSFTFGVGVLFEDTWPEQLERVLGARFAALGDARRVESVNLGVPGFDALDVLRYLETRVAAYQPDVVLYLLYLNDLRPRDPAALAGAELELDALLHEGPRGPARYSRLLAVVQRERARRRYNEAFRLEDALAQGTKDRDLRLRAFGRVVEAARGLGVDFKVVLFPVLEGLEGEYAHTRVHAELQGFFESQGVEVLDLLPTFRGRTSHELWVHPTDAHPNEQALSLAVEAMRARFWP